MLFLHPFCYFYPRSGGSDDDDAQQPCSKRGQNRQTLITEIRLFKILVSCISPDYSLSCVQAWSG